MIELKRIYPTMSLKEIKDTEFCDLEILFKAHQKSNVDSMFLESFNAWQNRVVNATKRSGSYIVTKFEDLFDYKKLINGDDEDKEVRRFISKKALAKVAELNNREVTNNG